MSKFLNPKNYLNFALSKFIRLMYPIIKLWEKKYIEKYAGESLSHQPIFIIGAPRTGSTILYQTITNQFDVLYIDNFICNFNRNFFFGFWLSDKLFKQKSHNCFRSKHGSTSICGLHAPSECGEFWYKWLPTDKHFIDYNDITDDIVEEIRNEISAVINYFDKPLVFKNLNAGQRLKLLQKCFPNAKFITVKRDPLFTAQSILKAKRKIGISDDKFWSVMPKNVKKLEILNCYEQIIKQIYYLEKQIVEDVKLFKKNSFLNINYIELGNNFNDILVKCQKFIETNERVDYKKADIKLTEKISLKKDEIEKFNEQIEKLDWEFYSDK
ncbi:sulfotransferase [Halarcobacter sp.]|uniref:sulfotransferase n=1 Tax=Halarcobacter sp. TaxID=2321133 RepID=UPI002AAB6023|nr:sulfotransferase [Halarcobacter sp.]